MTSRPGGFSSSSTFDGEEYGLLVAGVLGAAAAGATAAGATAAGSVAEACCTPCPGLPPAPVEAVSPVASAVGEKVLEIGVPLQVLGVELGSQINLLLVLSQHGRAVAHLPEQGMHTVSLEAFERA